MELEGKSAFYALTEPLIFLAHEAPPEASRDAQLVRLLQERIAVEVLCYLGRAFQTPFRVSMFSRSRGLFKRHSRAIVRALRERARPGRLLWVSGNEMARYIPIAKAMGYRILREERDLDFLKNPLASARRNRAESRFCRHSDYLIAASDLDASRLAKIAHGSPIHVIPHSVMSSEFVSVRKSPGSDLLFFGPLDQPGVIAGLEWFMREVLPKLRASIGARLPRIVVAGRGASSGLADSLKAHGLELESLPDTADLNRCRALLEASAMVLFPSRSGQGSRLHILMAMAAGRPVVSTGRACEGLVLSPSYDIWIADRADGFAVALVRLLDNESVRRQLGERAAETIDKHYDWQSAGLKLDVLLKALLGPA